MEVLVHDSFELHKKRKKFFPTSELLFCQLNSGTKIHNIRKLV